MKGYRFVQTPRGVHRQWVFEHAQEKGFFLRDDIDKALGVIDLQMPRMNGDPKLFQSFK